MKTAKTAVTTTSRRPVRAWALVFPVRPGMSRRQRAALSGQHAASTDRAGRDDARDLAVPRDSALR